MDRVLIATTGWGTLWAKDGAAATGGGYRLKLPQAGQLAAINTTVYAGPTGGATIAPAAFISNDDGVLPGWVEQGSYTLTVGGVPMAVEAIAGSLAADAARLSAANTFAQPQQMADGTVPLPALTFASDTDTGIVRLGANRMGFVVGGVLAAYLQTDGTFILPDSVAGDPANLTAGTAPGSVVLGRNRALRAINPAGTGTTRLVTLGSSDQIVIGSGGAEGGAATQIVLRAVGGPKTELYDKTIIHDNVTGANPCITFDPNAGVYIGLDRIGAGATFLTTKRTGDTVARVAVLENGRAEYGPGNAAADVIVIPRNNAGEWRLATGRILLNDTSGNGGCIELGERTDVAAPSSDGARLYTRDNGAGKTQLCARFATGAVQVIATQP